jgi:hypothetical protein
MRNAPLVRPMVSADLDAQASMARLTAATITAWRHDAQREVAAALARLPRSLGFEKVTVVFEQPPAR